MSIRERLAAQGVTRLCVSFPPDQHSAGGAGRKGPMSLHKGQGAARSGVKGQGVNGGRGDEGKILWLLETEVVFR